MTQLMINVLFSEIIGLKIIGLYGLYEIIGLYGVEKVQIDSNSKSDDKKKF